MDLIIRHYSQADRQTLSELSADTAYFGEPVEAFLEDRRLYTDAFVSYYLDHESAYVWVAASGQEVIGFLLGCTDTLHQSRHWRRYILTKVLSKALAGRYRLGRRTAGFAAGMLLGALSGESVAVDLEQYPAHLQIDIRAGHRGLGVGGKLIAAYLDQLRQLGVYGVHLETTSHNQAACHLYEKVGFQLLDQRPNRYWTRILGYSVHNRSYGLRLG